MPWRATYSWASRRSTGALHKMTDKPDELTAAFEALTPKQRKLRERSLALTLGIMLAFCSVFPLAFLADHFELWGAFASEFEAEYTDWRDPRLIEHERLVLERLEWSRDLPQWAGSYFRGASRDGFGNTYDLRLAPAAGFVWTPRGCVAREQVFGTVRVDGSRVRLDPDVALLPDGFLGTDEREEFVFVPWGNRKYLIAPNQMLAFARDIRNGSEPRPTGHGDYFAGFDDSLPKPTGRPALPEEYASLLDFPPFRARVSEVLSPAGGGSSDNTAARVRLDVGERDGVYAGLRLSLDSTTGQSVGWSTVVEVGQRDCIAKIRFDSQDPRPQVGWTFVPYRWER